jgi:HTH-type transcriptional regulator/antitoxin HigA
MVISQFFTEVEAARWHPAIVAGRWQREHNDYRRFSKMLGRGEVGAQLLDDDVA